jgi:hypothetical protein
MVQTGRKETTVKCFSLDKPTLRMLEELVKAQDRSATRLVSRLIRREWAETLGDNEGVFKTEAIRG